MSFFIRNSKKNSKFNPLKRKAGNSQIHTSKNSKKSKSVPKLFTQVEDEEIPSDDEDVQFDDHGKASDEEENLTAQEKKLQLAKKYLKEIENEEKEKLENDSQLDNNLILGRLKEEVLSQAGKLRKTVANEIKKEYGESDMKILRCKEQKLAITCVVVSDDCLHVYSGSKDGSIVKWTVEGVKVKSIPPRHKDKKNENLHSSKILSLAISYDNKYLASSDESNVIQIWNPENMTHLCSFKGHRAGVTGLAFCRTTQNLYSCSEDRAVKVWSMPEKAYIETLFGHQNPITSIDVLSHDRAVTSGGTDNTCRVWKIAEESQLIYLGNNVGSIDCVKRLDEKHFVSCGDEGSILIWGISKKKPLCTLSNAHGLDSHGPHWITSLACISNSEVFASGSSDGLIRIWQCEPNFRSASLMASISIPGFVNSMAFSADHKHLVVGVGQEHRLGRWKRLKEAKNSVVIISVT